MSECDQIRRFGKILRFSHFFKKWDPDYRSKQILLFGYKIVLIGFRTKFKTIKKSSRGVLNIHSMVLAEYQFWVNIPSKSNNLPKNHGEEISTPYSIVVNIRNMRMASFKKENQSLCRVWNIFSTKCSINNFQQNFVLTFFFTRKPEVTVMAILVQTDFDIRKMLVWYCQEQKL